MTGATPGRDDPCAGLFTPPYPDPRPRKASLIARFFTGWHSWIHVLFEKSYTMKMGEIRTPGAHTYIANDPPLVKRVLDDYHGFPKSAFFLRLLAPAIGNSVFSANGREWEEQRAMVKPVFQATALPRTLPMMRAAADDLIARMHGLDLSRPIDVDPLMTHVAADVIFRTLFSVPLDAARARAIHTGFGRYQRLTQSAATLAQFGLPTLGYRRRSENAAAIIHAAFADIVRDRYDAYHAHGERRHDDLLQGLLEARHPEAAAPFAYTGVMEQVSTVFLAGHETSASALCWALYCLACDPPTQDAARAEVAEHVGTGPIPAEALRRMTLLRDVFRETLRLYPPVAFLPREVGCPTQMRDKQLEAGATMVVSPWLVHRNRDHWRCPHAFDPTRFEDPANREAIRASYLPFGQGPRICIGAGLATQEASVILASILRAFDLAPVAGDVPEPVSRLTLRPRNGLRLRITPRG